MDCIDGPCFAIYILLVREKVLFELLVEDSLFPAFSATLFRSTSVRETWNYEYAGALIHLLKFDSVKDDDILNLNCRDFFA